MNDKFVKSSSTKIRKLIHGMFRTYHLVSFTCLIFSKSCMTDFCKSSISLLELFGIMAGMMEEDGKYGFIVNPFINEGCGQYS